MPRTLRRARPLVSGKIPKVRARDLGPPGRCIRTVRAESHHRGACASTGADWPVAAENQGINSVIRCVLIRSFRQNLQNDAELKLTIFTAETHRR